MPSRLEALGGFLHAQTSRLIIMTLFYSATGIVPGPKRLKNADGQMSNAHLWELE